MRVTIELNKEEIKILSKRAKRNLMTLKEQIEDIVRRSCVSYKEPRQNKFKVDDKLVEIFSRHKSGRKQKKVINKKSIKNENLK